MANAKRARAVAQPSPVSAALPLWFVLVVLVGCFLAGVANAEFYKLDKILIGHPWSRAARSGQETGGLYMGLLNKGADDTLISVTTPVAAGTEILLHEKPVRGILLATDKGVKLSRENIYIALRDIKRDLKEGDTYPAELTFQRAGRITVNVTVGVPAVDQ